MNNFQELPPQERGLVIAKLYHNAWYNQDRFDIIMKLIEQWDEEPVREAKFLHEIQEEVNINDIIN